jgi:hypothetical protein
MFRFIVSSITSLKTVAGKINPRLLNSPKILHHEVEVAVTLPRFQKNYRYFALRLFQVGFPASRQ